MSKPAEEPSLPNPSESSEDRTLVSTNLSDSSKTEEIGAGGDSASCRDVDSVSVSSETSSEKRLGIAKPSGIKPPSKISRPCAGAHKPGLPVTPPKSKFFFA